MDNFDNEQKEATQECLNENLLSDINGMTRINNTMPQGQHTGFLYVILQIPNNFQCQHCLLQVNYIINVALNLIYNSKMNFKKKVDMECSQQTWY